jgi:NAD(P)-dependent dehydrogenase (short-subunit alcohol dehydrogenase family)
VNASLRGKVAIVTGAAGDIGRAITKRFLSEGARVALLDLANTNIEETTRGSYANHADALGIECDVTRSDDIERAVAATLNHFGAIDVLINNAGVAPMQAFLETELPLYDRVMGVNVRGSFVMALACAHQMASQRSGCIVQIASTCAFSSGASKNLCAYNMSKAAVRQMVASLAAELAPLQIRVNAVAPGNIDTRMTRACLLDDAATAAAMAEIPLGHFGSPSDVSGACAFLCSVDAQYITGATLLVDGGWLVR